VSEWNKDAASAAAWIVCARRGAACGLRVSAALRCARRGDVHGGGALREALVIERGLTRATRLSLCPSRPKGEASALSPALPEPIRLQRRARGVGASGVRTLRRRCAAACRVARVARERIIAAAASRPRRAHLGSQPRALSRRYRSAPTMPSHAAARCVRRAAPRQNPDATSCAATRAGLPPLRRARRPPASSGAWLRRMRPREPRRWADALRARTPLVAQGRKCRKRRCALTGASYTYATQRRSQALQTRWPCCVLTPASPTCRRSAAVC
jgi:hypothetical protein